LELFQQLTYPNYWFSGREVMETTGDLEIRLGLYKFYMTGINLVILAAFYCWDRLLKNFNKRLLYLFIFLIIGIYAFLARKMDFSFIICIAISYFLTKKRKWYYGFLILTFFSLLYIYSDKIFGDFIEKTQSELSDDDFIRFQSMGFYLNYFDDPLTLILGNSREYGDSAYGEYVHSIQENLHFYRADIGVLAHFSYYGLIGLIPIILFVIFLIKKWTVLPLYIKLYFIFNGIQIIMAFPLNSVIGSFTFTIVLYLMELILQRNRIQYLSKCNNQLKLKTNIATFKWLY
jgi:hypothetical protein